MSFAKESIFIALFLYMLFWYMPKLKAEFKQDMRDMENRHIGEIERIEKKHDDEIEKLEKKSEKRESELMRLLTMFGDKYDILTTKVDEVLKKLER